MKNTKIMAVLAVLLVAALFIGAASAAERAVATGETAYIGENITITGAAGPWIALAGSGSTSPVATNVTGGSYISLTSISVATYDVLKSDDGSAWNKDSTLTVTVADLPTVSITPAEIYVNTELSATLNAVLPNGVSEVSVSYNGVETTLTTTTATVIGKAVAGQTDITLTKVNGIASFATAPDVATITVSSTSDADIDNFTAAPDATEIATGSSVTIDINATKQLTTPVWLSWGDGTTEQLDFASSVNVSMSHTYALADTYPVIVMNGPTPGQSTRLKTVSTITVTGTAGEIVVDMPITAAQGSTVEITFTSMGVVQPANVTVKFGDGQTKTASFSSIQGGFEAVVENIYATVGTYTVSYTINGVETEAGEITITPAEYRYIQGTGQDVFVYEHIDVNTVVSGASKLTKYSDGAIPSAVNVIAGTAGKFYLTEEVVNGQYGKYVIDGNYDASGFVYVWYPELSLQAELTTGANGATSGDSIDGKNVNKDTVVSFLINAPKVGPAFYNNAAQTGATAKIVFTTPASGKTTTFGTGTYALPFGTVTLTSAQTMAGYTQAGEDATAGTWTAQAEYTSPQAFSDYAKKSNTISFTLQSSTLTITASKDSVVRSNPFTVTIGGKSQTEYAVYIESPATNEVNPTLQPAQSGFQSSYNAPAPEKYYSIVNGEIYYAGYSDAIGGVFKTDASGKRTIQFNTAANTEDKTYTIKVSGLTTNDAGAIIFDSGDYDKVKVKVEKGAVTISASGDGSYYLGDEIKLSGTNSDSKLVFLFITGKNLGSADGNVLKSLPTLKQAALATNPVVVNTDNTWEYKWDTSRISVDPGAYTIYATSRLTNGKASTPFNVDGKESEMYGSKIEGEDGLWAVKLSDSEYATISVNLKKPFLSAVPSGTVVAKGDSFYVRGTAEGNPNSLKIYIFGNNFFEDYSVSVEDDGNYEKKIDIPEGMSSGQYFVVIQHPMMNAMFDADLAQDEDGYEYFYIPNVKLAATSSQSSFYVTGSDRLPGDQAADALTKMIDSPNIDDIYTKLTFNVADAWIRIANPGDKAAGSKFTISGTTNLAIDDQVLVEVSSSSFEATEKTQDLGNSGVTQTTKVVAGESGDNVWSIEVDTTNWKLDEYSIKAQGIEVDATTTTNFNLLEKLPDTPKPTETGTQATTTATATATTTPTQTPGFGAFVALAGLGAVALLVLRRN